MEGRSVQQHLAKQQKPVFGMSWDQDGGNALQARLSWSTSYEHLLVVVGARRVATETSPQSELSRASQCKIDFRVLKSP
jgi:hypothetical protein